MSSVAPDIDALIAPWLETMRAQVPGLELFDAHTHVGQNDPDGMKQTPAELLEVLHRAGARGCFVFPMHEPDGYPPANDFVIAQAASAPDGMFVPFCRVKPGQDAIAEARRALAAGARGIKLHPRAEQFALDHPDVPKLFALAAERRLPVLIHAGRGIPALGEHVLRWAAEYPDARVILAHAGVSDLAWIWRVVPDTPNVLFDSAWGQVSDLLALFTLVPPGQIVFASDAPYGSTAGAAAAQLRIARQAGYSDDQLRLVFSEQSLRIARGEPLAVAGPAVGEHDHASHLLLDRVADLVQVAAMLLFRTGEGGDMLGLARQACDVPDEIDDAPVFAAIRPLLDAFIASHTADEPRAGRHLLMLAAAIARTPEVPLPASVP